MKTKYVFTIRISLSLVAFCASQVLCQNAHSSPAITTAPASETIDVHGVSPLEVNTNIDARNVMDVVFKTEVEEAPQDIKNQAIIEEINKRSARSFDGLDID